MVQPDIGTDIERRDAQHTAGYTDSSARNVVAILIVIVAAMLLALSVPAIWLNRMVTDTEVYVETVAPLAEDPDIQNAVAAAVSEALIEKIDAQSRFEQVLPESLELLVIPIVQAMDDFVNTQALEFVRSDRFAAAWERTNRVGHKALVAAVTGRDTGAVGVEAGTITLDLGTLADEIKTGLMDSGFELAARIPTSGIEKQVVLYESPMLAQLSSAIDVISKMAMWIPGAGMALAVIAIILASDRRRVVLWLGGALAFAALLPLGGLYFSQSQVTAQLYRLASIPTPAAQSAFHIIFRDLVAADQGMIVVGLALWGVALLVGPTGRALATRLGLSGAMLPARTEVDHAEDSV